MWTERMVLTLRVPLRTRFDTGLVLGRDEGADLSRFVGGVADAQLAGAAGQGLGERLQYPLLNEEARAGAAVLPGVGEDRVDGAIDDSLDIHIVEDDVGTL